MDSVKYRDSRNHQCHCMSFITFFFMSTTCSPSCINIYIQANNNSNYTVRFLENENAPYGHNYGLIDFQLSSVKEGEKLAIVPTFTLLNRKANLPEDIEHDQQSMESIVSNQIVPLLNNEFAKKHCPWICSSWHASYKKDQFGIKLILIMSKLEYKDFNGV